ncbi:MAG: PEP-CTERM sorting domain-containing protein [Planctomycetaceae bacterium]
MSKTLSVQPVMRRLAAALVVVCGAATASAGVFVDPSALATGTTPSGLQWSAVATGTALPIRTSATNPLNGAPGAVAYFNQFTGQIQFDPKGLNVSTFIMTYTTGTVNISGVDPGPFQYTTGTGANAWSPTTGSPRTFPAVTAVTGLDPTTQAARVAAQVGPPLAASLASSGDVGNIASGTGTWWNQGWAFPSDLVVSGSVATIVQGNFKTIGQGANANANILGYGSQQSVFQYTVSGVTGNQVGAVIPIPEPGTFAALGSSGVIAAVVRLRRRRPSRRHSG